MHIVCKEQANDATREGPRQAVVSTNDGGMSCLVSFPTTGPVLGLCLEGGGGEAVDEIDAKYYCSMNVEERFE